MGGEEVSELLSKLSSTIGLTTRPSVGGHTPAEGNCQKKSLYLALFEMR